MQRSRRVEVTVGLFAIITLAILFVTLFVIFEEKGAFQEKYTLTAVFNDVSGLEVGSPVYLAGVEVGIVTGIEILRKKQVKVTMSINKEAQKWITTDSVARVASLSIMGGRCVKISVGASSLKMPVIKDGGQIVKTKPLFEPIERTEEIAEKIGPTLDSIKKTAEDASRLVASLSGPIEDAAKLIQDVHGYTKEIFSDTGLYAGVQMTLKNLNQIGEALSESIPEITQRSEQIIRNLERISEDLKDMELNKTVEEITDEIRKGSESMRQLVREGTELAEKASREIEETGKIIDAVKEHWLIRRYLEPDVEEKPIPIWIRDSHYQE